jgi:hypothetical protein
MKHLSRVTIEMHQRRYERICTEGSLENKIVRRLRRNWKPLTIAMAVDCTVSAVERVQQTLRWVERYEAHKIGRSK